MKRSRWQQAMAAGAAFVVGFAGLTGPLARAEEPADVPAAEREAPVAAEGMRDPTARQASALLGVVIGTPREAEVAQVVRVWPGSPAARAGIREGDRILQVGEREIESAEGLRAAVLAHRPGDRVEVTVERDNKRTTVKVELGGADDFIERRVDLRPLREALGELLAPRAWLGVQVEEAERGVKVADVAQGSPAEKAELKTGDVIVRVGDTRVDSPAELRSAIADREPGQSVSLGIRRDGQRQTVDVELGRWTDWRLGVSELNEEEVRRLLDRMLDFARRRDSLRLDLEFEPRETERQELEPRETERQEPVEREGFRERRLRERRLRQRIEELEQEVRELREKLKTPE